MKVNVLPLKTVRNPRDLGGYVGFEGRKVKSHRLIRSGKISDLSETDKEFLVDYGLKQIIDLRSPMEYEACPDDGIKGVEHLLMPLSDQDNTQGGKYDIQKAFQAYRKDQYAGFKMMCNRYYDHVTRPHAQKTIHNILETLANTETGATLYHCSEGKDRTGLVTVFILYILGVDMEIIRNDYLYSNYMLEEYRALRDRMFKDDGENLKFRANMRILGSVADAFLDTSLITVTEDYGSLDNYIRNQLSITPELRDRLRELYLEEK